MCASTKLQLTCAKRGCSWRWTTCTAAAPASWISAAHSYALWRPPTISTCAPLSSPKSTRSQVCVPSGAQPGRRVKYATPGAATTVRALMWRPDAVHASQPGRSRVTSSSTTSIPACAWNHAP